VGRGYRPGAMLGPAETLRVLQRAQQITEAALGPDYPTVGVIRRNL
jgi:hypothetical protein